MAQISSDILALTSEAAVLVQRGKIIFANTAAMEGLGMDCVGKSLSALFGPNVAGAQAPSFVADVPVNGKHCAVRVSGLENQQLIFFSPVDREPAVLNEPLLCAMRSSLMAIGIAADKVREQAEKNGDAQTLSTLSTLTRNYYRMIRMISNASLALSLSSDDLPFSPCVLNLSALCSELAAAVGYFCPRPELRLEPGENILLSADPSYVHQLLMNLLSNCLVHAEGCTRISINLLETSDSVILSVSDNGRGIPPEQLHTVFDRYRHAFDISRMNDGAGLGLTAARRIAELHGGTLLLESRLNQGTTVRVSFSRRASAAVRLCTPGPGARCSAKDVLLWLSDCLPAELYTEKYMD